MRGSFPPGLPAGGGISGKDDPASLPLSGLKISGAKLLRTAKAATFSEDKATAADNPFGYPLPSTQYSGNRRPFAAASSLCERPLRDLFFSLCQWLGCSAVSFRKRELFYRREWGRLDGPSMPTPGRVKSVRAGLSSPPKNSPPDCFSTILLARFARAKWGVVSSPAFLKKRMGTCGTHSFFGRSGGT